MADKMQDFSLPDLEIIEVPHDEIPARMFEPIRRQGDHITAIDGVIQPLKGPLSLGDSCETRSFGSLPAEQLDDVDSAPKSPDFSPPKPLRGPESGKMSRNESSLEVFSSHNRPAFLSEFDDSQNNNLQESEDDPQG